MPAFPAVGEERMPLKLLLPNFAGPSSPAGVNAGSWQQARRKNNPKQSNDVLVPHDIGGARRALPAVYRFAFSSHASKALSRSRDIAAKTTAC